MNIFVDNQFKHLISKVIIGILLILAIIMVYRITFGYERPKKFEEKYKTCIIQQEI